MLDIALQRENAGYPQEAIALLIDELKRADLEKKVVPPPPSSSN